MIFDDITTLDELKNRLGDTRRPSNALPSNFKATSSDILVTIMDAINSLMDSGHTVLMNSVDLDTALSGTGTTEFYVGLGSFDEVNLRWNDSVDQGWSSDRWSKLGAKLLVSGVRYEIFKNGSGYLELSKVGPPEVETSYSIIVEEPSILDYMLMSKGIVFPDFATPTQKRQLLRTAISYDAVADRVTGWLAHKNTVDGWTTYLNMIAPEAVGISVDQKHLKGRAHYYGKRGFGYPNQEDINSAGTDNDICPYFWSHARNSKDATIYVTGTVSDSFKEFIEQSSTYFVPMADGGRITLTFIYN